MNARLAAVKVLQDVVERKKSLNDALAPFQAHEQRSLISELSYGVCRYYFQLKPILKKLLSKPIKAKDHAIELAILIGLHQLKFLSIKSFVAVNETVKLAALLNKNSMKGLINAVLRAYARDGQALEQQLQQTLGYAFQTAHPDWMIEQFKRAGYDMPTLLSANNQQAPITLNINLQKISTADYLDALSQAGIEAKASSVKDGAVELLSKVNVTALPFFNEGFFIVQDIAAQLSTQLLDLKDNQRVLDACSAPGGKLMAMLQTAKQFKQVVALDNNERRIERIKQNLQRLNLSAELICGDASLLDNWWDKQMFDRILLDAPCSALGVIRRHPDIKLLRTQDAVDNVVRTQQSILTALWQTLKPGGRLVYATCSVLPQENELQLEQFLQAHPDAVSMPFELPIGKAKQIGWQCLPPISDGFYYAVLEKKLAP